MTPQPPDLTWRPCDHERGVIDGHCVSCGAEIPDRKDHT